jgi:hypothetical protein
VTTRAQVKATLRNFLLTGTDDPVYGDTGGAGVATILDPIVQQSVDSLISEIHKTNRAYLSRTQILAADTPATGRVYSFATQSSPILDFSYWMEVRYTDENGSLLYEAKLEELRDAGSDYFCITGPDDSAALQTSPDSSAATAIYLRFGYWPPLLTSDSSNIVGIPTRYMDVVALEALFAFGLGGESRWPEELRERWRDRRAALIAHVAQRGVQNQRTRLYQGAGSYL